jgi:hypothetical protein
MTANTGQRGKRAGDNNAGAGQLGHESLGWTARTGQPGNVGMVQAGQKREERMSRTGQKDWAAGIGQRWQDSHDSKVGA